MLIKHLPGRNFCREVVTVYPDKISNKNSSTRRSSAKLFLLKIYTIVANKDVSLTGANLRHFQFDLKLTCPHDVKLKRQVKITPA